MRDDVVFETRLADALGRLADLAPTMDDGAVARQAIVAGGSARRMGWLPSLRGGGLDRAAVGRPWLRVGYVLIVLVLVLAAIAGAGAGGAVRRDRPFPPGRNGAIAFTVQGNNHGPALTRAIDADGSGDRAIDAGRCPTYSTDGSVLASLSYEGSAYLETRGIDGGLLHRMLLVDAPPTAVSYDLSPDGAQVAWFKPTPSSALESTSPDGTSGTAGYSVELWVAPIAGGSGTRIVPASSSPNEFFGSPLWSPDGGRIAFGRYVVDVATGERRRAAIYVVRTDGSDLRSLTARPASLEDGMSWSPDGRYLAYLGLPDGPPTATPATVDAPSIPARDVFVISADGSGDRNLTSTPASESQPRWSPDGASLAFESSVDGETPRLTTIHMDGQTPLDGPSLGPESAWFVWSPEGTELLWLEVSMLDAETSRSTIHSIDREFRQSPRTLQTVDGLIVCTPSWQRLEP